MVGSFVGAFVAVGWRGASEDEPPKLPAAAAKPVAAGPPTAPSVMAPKVSAPVASVASVASVAPEPEALGDAPVSSREEFEAAAIACDRKDARACRRAALASELGTVVPKDPERAKTFRKVELTVLVRGCEKGGVEACLTLADRYLRGEGLEQNDRTATALIDHAKELCAHKPEAACSGIPTN